MKNARVLVVDDDHNLRRMVCALLHQEGYLTSEAATGDAGLAKTESFEPQVVLLDLAMPGLGGLDILEVLSREVPESVVIMMSGQATLGDAVKATRSGAFQFLEKPLSPESLLTTVRGAAELAQVRGENRAYRQAISETHHIVGASRAIAQVRETIKQVAATDARVLITGESGTGKELVAKAIHAQSVRRHRPLISLNCAAIPSDLIESELFGHEKGAFTGAHRRRLGRFELAHGGTLFLDEVADLDLGAQAKLLRVLETGRVERVGGETSFDVDVRVIAATNTLLERAVDDGRFREDLFYRLNVFPIQIPPLRDRSDDVPQLVRHFARAVAQRSGRAPIQFAAPAVTLFVQHHWRGNVRELANVVERLVILTPPDEPVSLPLIQQMLGGERPTLKHVATPDGSTGLASALEACEKSLILAALQQAEGNVAEAARALQTDRANLYRRMRRLGISRNRAFS